MNVKLQEISEGPTPSAARVQPDDEDELQWQEDLDHLGEGNGLLLVYNWPELAGIVVEGAFSF